MDKVFLPDELAQFAPEMAALLPGLNLEVLHDFREFNRASFRLEELHDGLDVDDHSITSFKILGGRPPSDDSIYG